MTEKETAMQSEEVEEAVDSTQDPETSVTETMIYTNPTETPSPKAASGEAQFYTNLEDDIEKVEVSSRESSDQHEEEPEIVGTGSNFIGIPEQHPNESIKTWLQRITELQRKLNFDSTTSSLNSNNNNNNNSNNKVTTQTSNATPRIVKFQDLPYMGEMTLDNSKPRRGRKPKKADICHLIYKNYGTIFPGTPNPKSYLEKDVGAIKKQSAEHEHSRSNVQNKIISSLLEKRLTQQDVKKTLINNNNNSNSNNNTESGRKKPSLLKLDQHEPLNLCIRDLNHLKIRLLKKSDGEIKIERDSDNDGDDDDDDVVEIVQEIPTKIKAEPDNSSSESGKNPELSGPGGYVYWPNAGVFIHPMALQQQLMYYQRMAANNSYTLPNSRPPSSEAPAAAVTASSATNQNSSVGNPELRKLIPKQHHHHHHHHHKKKLIPASPTSENCDLNNETDVQSGGGNSSLEMKTKRNATSSSACSEKTPTKRKRSAIFIPPIPTENNTNPATEVSICKFKFTGGAKPSLQEKKMLSVDSGGNFRYYSGTGDKSMRGYEFFPRETLQQQINNSQGSSTGAFLQASGEKIYPIEYPGSKSGSGTSPVGTPNTPTTSEFLLTPEVAAAAAAAAAAASVSSSPPNLPDFGGALKHKKRKSRKSLQREKLEQTFKEKGFLIQTQQLESAEGATYCKFRQLRKFTRYLFRSWKDYLPGNVRELQENGEKMVIDGDLADETEQEIDNLSRHSSELSNQNVQ